MALEFFTWPSSPALTFQVYPDTAVPDRIKHGHCLRLSSAHLCVVSGVLLTVS